MSDFNNFLCPKCGSNCVDMVWAHFVTNNGVLVNKAFLIYDCCSKDPNDKIEVGQDFDWKSWVEYQDSLHKSRSYYWEDQSDFYRDEGQD